MKPPFKPFTALRISDSSTAKQVLAPPYDVLTYEEARQLGAISDKNFVHVSRAEINLSGDHHNSSSQTVYELAAQALNQLVDKQVLTQDETPYWYIIKITDDDGHKQVGFGGIASCAAYEKNIIAQHELTRPDKEDDRLNQIETTQAQTGPVLLVHEDNQILDKFAQDIIDHHKPDIEARVEFNRAFYQMWIIRDIQQIETISQQFNMMKKMWIADGHHRAAAAYRLSKKYPDNKDCGWFLATSFPASQMKLLAYHRFVTQCHISLPKLLAQLENNFAIQEITKLRLAKQKGEMIMLIEDKIFALKISPQHSPNSRAEALDVAILTNHILSPIFDIHNLREDQRISFIGSNKQPEEIWQKVKETKDSIAFLMYPVQMQDIMDIASHGEIMPPKSTWFEPKLADGLINHKIHI